MTAPIVSPLGALRQATRALHERIDNSAFAQALHDGSLSMSHYRSFLRAVFQIVGTLEEAVERSGDAALRAACAHAIERRARLTRDLEYLGVDPRAVDAAV